ncbi:MAG: putative cobaltochelatase [Deltaproteobacteria bacterium]|nr:putative cobaltochelatase [Deltaproteobacteria bacterium]MBW2069253.1 putative cobaltochelatase [Deltaproteobacteria bacterium]
MKAFKRIFPFSAIVGQERLKKALILNAINPAIGGVLIRGEKGTAKSTAVRSFAAVLPEVHVVAGCPFSCDPDNPAEWCRYCRSLKSPPTVISRPVSIVTLPLNATEDRVVGSIDFERTIKTGERHFHPGVLAKAHRGILYIDEVNLLDDYIVELILDVAASGINRVEREGISFSHPAKFILVGTMNPEEGDIRPQLLDRFGLCVEVQGESDLERRVELMSFREEFDLDPDGFIQRFEKIDRSVAMSIVAARELLPRVKTNDRTKKFISDLCLENNVAGHRADIVMEQAARAVAALKGRLYVTVQDVQEIATMVLTHRRREALPPPPPPPQLSEETDTRKDQPPKDKPPDQQKPPEHQPEHNGRAHGQSMNQTEADEERSDEEREGKENLKDRVNYKHVLERVFEIGQTFKVRKISGPKDRILRRGSGRRSRTRTAQKQGRYVRSSLKGDGSDVALDATLRAAAPHQLRRRSNSFDGLAVYLTPQDLRHKIREKRIGNFLLFVVDASGSMGAQGRMSAAKGAIMSLLLDAYQKRDRVAMITFRQNEAQLQLPPTSSVELAAKLLKELPVGGRTPLSAGLIKAYEVVKRELLKDPSTKPIVIVITDGKANVSVGQSKKPLEEAMIIAGRFTLDDRITSIVVDTEKAGIMQFGLARRLAEYMDGLYFRIDDLKASDLVHIIKEEVTQ